jgi:hypothetical protein
MTNAHITAITNLHTTEDFVSQYENLLRQRVFSQGVGVTGFADLKAAVKLAVEAEGDQEGRDEFLEYESFEDFFGWYDALTAFDQMDSEDKVVYYKALLEVVYRALLTDYQLLAQAEAFVEGTPDDTMQVVEQLKALHPNLLWGTAELGDYDQFADTDAPAHFIYFSPHFDQNREEFPDPYTDLYGAPDEPSAHGLSDDAARVLRQHNKIHLLRDPRDVKNAWVFKTVEGVEASLALTSKLLLESAAFKVVPMPDDYYEFSVKHDRKSLFL